MVNGNDTYKFLIRKMNLQLKTVRFQFSQFIIIQLYIWIWWDSNQWNVQPLRNNITTYYDITTGATTFDLW